jgi:hypothetical protein
MIIITSLVLNVKDSLDKVTSLDINRIYSGGN